MLKPYYALRTCLALFVQTVLFGQTCIAQIDLPATRLSGATTTAGFTLGLSLTNGTTFQTTALTTDSLKLMGTIKPEPTQVSQDADIYVVAELGGNWFMRNQDGNFVPWNSSVPSLVAFRSKQTLTNNHPVDFLTGSIPIVGTFNLFMGYKANDGDLIFTPQPRQISITTPIVVPPNNTVREQATELFASRISSIIQTNPGKQPCITCHINRGLAGNTSLIFVPTTNSNHLSLNFDQFVNLATRRGKNYMLDTVQGRNEHTSGSSGGRIFFTTDQGYKDLDSFLQLVEKL
jgi:hypothetical protein